MIAEIEEMRAAPAPSLPCSPERLYLRKKFKITFNYSEMDMIESADMYVYVCSTVFH
jgi:hypothetical protein